MERKKICVVGIGYIGLPTAAIFAIHGHHVTGVDINENVVNELNQGKVTIKEPYLDILVQAAVTSGNLVAKMEPEEADIFIIAVPTPVTGDKTADMTCVIAAAESIVPFLRDGNTVVLESTSPAGTVKNLLCPILAKSGLAVGSNVFVAYSPERVMPGNIINELVYNNRIIGGINSQSTELVRDLYSTFTKGDILLTDETTAEVCKLTENTYRDVNIALANELLKICEKIGINVWEVIELCNKHPRVNIHNPGPGVGGHCLAVDPWFIVERFPDIANIIKTSRRTNDSMPQYVADKIEDILKDIKGKKAITFLGITYKADVDDVRESPIMNLIDLLNRKNDYEIRAFDPLVHNFKYKVNNIENACNGSDLLVIGVNHKQFDSINYNELYKLMRNKRIFDLRNSLRRIDMERIGFSFSQLGN